jgi:NAD(P)H-hydrate repair Nnr-like enzyme with NAD(P)H-hydrate epimerase domain
MAPGVGQTDSTRAFLGEILIARLNPHTAKIKAIGVPTGLNGRIGADFAAAVMTNRVSQSVDLSCS